MVGEFGDVGIGVCDDYFIIVWGNVKSLVKFVGINNWWYIVYMV